MRNIRQNLALSLVYNLLGVPVAAGVLYPIFGIVLSPMLAAAAMSLSSVSVIANALRLRLPRPQCPRSKCRAAQRRPRTRRASSTEGKP
jgi:Cu+-exporting ATPase